MTPITVEGVQLYYVPTIHRLTNDERSGFDCKDCTLKLSGRGCVRMRGDDLYFEKYGAKTEGLLFCINAPNDIVFINNTPEDIARYVAARLDNT